MNDNKIDKLEIKTPLASLAAKGIRVSDIISIIVVSALTLLLYILWDHKEDAKAGALLIAKALREQVVSQQEQTRAQNLTTCIMSLDITNREEEFKRYMNREGFCRRIVADLK